MTCSDKLALACLHASAPMEKSASEGQRIDSHILKEAALGRFGSMILGGAKHLGATIGGKAGWGLGKLYGGVRGLGSRVGNLVTGKGFTNTFSKAVKNPWSGADTAVRQANGVSQWADKLTRSAPKYLDEAGEAFSGFGEGAQSFMRNAIYKPWSAARDMTRGAMGLGDRYYNDAGIRLTNANINQKGSVANMVGALGLGGAVPLYYGAKEGENMALDAAAQQMHQMKNMPMWQRLAVGFNPGLMDKHLPEELQKRMAALSQGRTPTPPRIAQRRDPYGLTDPYR